jgi:hypothetical protein
MVGMLYAVGYLDADIDKTGQLAELIARLKQPEVEIGNCAASSVPLPEADATGYRPRMRSEQARCARS